MIIWIGAGDCVARTAITAIIKSLAELIYVLLYLAFDCLQALEQGKFSQEFLP